MAAKACSYLMRLPHISTLPSLTLTRHRTYAFALICKQTAQFVGLIGLRNEQRRWILPLTYARARFFSLSIQNPALDRSDWVIQVGGRSFFPHFYQLCDTLGEHSHISL